eukprot:scaffold27994_cov49-Attheya_sp.AAC.1
MMFHFGNVAVALLVLPACPGVHGFQLGSRMGAATYSQKNDKLFVSSVTMEGDAGVASEGSSGTPPDMKAFASGYKTAFQEVPFNLCKPSSGEVPADLVGTYFRCGPAMFSAGSVPPPSNSAVQPKTTPVPDGQDPDRMVKHPFEGDGAVLGVTFHGDGTATSRFRYVRTNAFTMERKKGQKLYTGMESTREASGGVGNEFPVPLFRHHLQPGLNKKRKNTSNTRVIYWAKKLLTLWEGGLPYKLDALALSTEGRSQLGGILKQVDPFGAKGAYDSVKDRMLFYSNRQDSGSSELIVYEFNSKFRLVRENEGKREAKLPGLALLSDFAVTDNYSIFVQPPVTVNGLQFMMSKEPTKTLTLEKGASLLHLIPRVDSSKNGGEVKSIEIPFDGGVEADLQFINAYEDDSGSTVVLDVIRSAGGGKNAGSWPWATSLSDYSSSSSKKSLWRYTINVSSGNVSKECMSDLQCSFGVINPNVSAQNHQYIYTAVGSMGNNVAPPQGLAKFDCKTKTSEVWLPKEYEFCGEPMYAPRKKTEETSKSDIDEDDGYILSVLYNGKSGESELVVLSAKDLKAGPMTRIPLGLGIPHGLHGCFNPDQETGWTADEIERRAKLADKMEKRGNMWNEVKSDFSGLGLRLDDFDEYFGDLL